MVRLLLRLPALHEVERLLGRAPLVDDRADSADHADRVRGLPDVASHVHAAGAFLDRLVREVEGVQLRLQFWTARDDEGYGTRFDDLGEVLAEIRLDEMGAELRRNPAGEAEVPGVSLLEFLSNRGQREDRHADILDFVDELPQVHQGIVFMGRADENRQGDRGGVQPDRLLHRGRDLLVREVLVQNAGAAADPQDDRYVRRGIDRRADDAS